MADEYGMSKSKVNVLKSMEAHFGGRPPTLSRKQVIAWEAACTNVEGFRQTKANGVKNPALALNEKGAEGLTLVYPQWLFNKVNKKPNPYVSGRGMTSPPWQFIDIWDSKQKEAKAAASTVAATAATLKAAAATVATSEVAQEVTQEVTQEATQEETVEISTVPANESRAERRARLRAEQAGENAAE